MKRAALILAFTFLAASAWAAPVVTVGTISGDAGTTVELAMNMTADAAMPVSTLQFDLTLPAGLSYVSVSTGTASNAANKGVQANVLSNGAVRVLIFGLNQTAIGSGSVARMRIAINGGQTAGSLPVGITGVIASDGNGTTVSISGTAGSVQVTSTTPPPPPPPPSPPPPPPPPPPASVQPIIRAGTATGNAGDTVDLPVTFSTGSTGVSTLQFDLTLPDGFSVNSMSAGDIVIAADKSASNNMIGTNLRVLIFGLNQNALSSGILVTVRMTIATGTASGVQPISMSGLSVSDADGGTVLTQGISGSITVGASAAVPADPTLHLESIIPVNGSIAAGYPEGGAPVTEFEWGFTQLSLAATTPAAALSRATYPNIRTTGRVANLAPQNLQPGLYRITVRAFNQGTPSAGFAQATVTLVAADFSSLNVYPNPWRSDIHNGDITFAGLPQNTTLKLFTLSGHAVKTFTTSAGSQTWNLTNDSGDKVASGLYLYLLTTDNGQRSRGKLAIIK